MTISSEGQHPTQCLKHVNFSSQITLSKAAKGAGAISCSCPVKKGEKIRPIRGIYSLVLS